MDVTDSATSYREMIDSLASALGLPTQRYRLTGGRSDHMSFADVGIPSVMLFTGFHSDYHRRTDVPSRVDAVGIVRITDLIESIVRATPTLGRN